MLKLTTPLTDKTLSQLKTGDKVFLSGVIYTARDAAHKKFGIEIEGTRKFGHMIYSRSNFFWVRPNAIDRRTDRERFTMTVSN